jgi:hypothetical protein
MSQDAIQLIAHQRELEKLFNKNQLITRIKSEFMECVSFDFSEYMEDKGIPRGFGYDLLVQMALHKRCDLQTLIGLLDRHFHNVQETADMLWVCAEADLVDWSPDLKIFVVCFNITKEVQEELDRYQFPLPMVVRPRTVGKNTETGMLLTEGSLILKKNHHDGDICLDHINRMNSTQLTINHNVANMIQNQWRNLDKMKPGETSDDFKRRKKAFEKYDRTAREVMDVVTKLSPVFYLTHKYCKRGRTHCQGYHVNYQGAPWNKAVVQFANEEVIQ